jgi:hypothetical protein
MVLKVEGDVLPGLELRKEKRTFKKVDEVMWTFSA